MGIATTMPPITQIAAIILGYRRVIAVRTHPLYPTSWELITHLQTSDGVLHPKQQVIDDIKTHRQHYYTSEDGNVAMLIVERSPLGNAYVRSSPDCTYVNNLLNLRRV